MKTSKEKILISALELFSTKGFSAVSMRELASSVGIKSASLYNHFKSKADILDCILVEAKSRYFDKRKNIKAPDNDDKSVAEKYNQMTKDTFLKICEELFVFYVTDPFMSNLRKFLCIEQFADKNMGELYKKYFYDDIIDSQTLVFKSFIDCGKFRSADPKIVAMHFYAPIFLLFTAYDNSGDLDGMLEIVKDHAIQFSKNYNLLYDEKVGF